MFIKQLDQPTREFVTRLFERMKEINPGVEHLELYEFIYGLETIFPDLDKMGEIELVQTQVIEKMVNSAAYYDQIQIKPRSEGKIILDKEATWLTQMLFVGLVGGNYSTDWVKTHFFFDLRGFYFLHRTEYFIPSVTAHLGGKPRIQFEQKQKMFVRHQSVGYPEFKFANLEVDGYLLQSITKMIEKKGTPIVVAIAGQTAAGKTEIVDRLKDDLVHAGKKVTSIEMDNFLIDREYRESKGIHSLGKEAIHLRLFLKCLAEIIAGNKISIPRYDFIDGGSSHDLEGRLNPGAKPIEIDPADIIFIEGNFPFLIEEVAPLIGIKAVYLTDDAVRLKRKWKRDIDYRKKYDPNYFRNRFFKDQFPMSKTCFIPQMEICDILVDTTGAAVWTTPEVSSILDA